MLVEELYQLVHLSLRRNFEVVDSPLFQKNDVVFVLVDEGVHVGFVEYYVEGLFEGDLQHLPQNKQAVGLGVAVYAHLLGYFDLLSINEVQLLL